MSLEVVEIFSVYDIENEDTVDCMKINFIIKFDF